MTAISSAVTIAVLVAAAALGGAGLLRWLRRQYAVVVIWGESMAPTLCSGDRVLLRRIRPAAVRAGQIVVLGREGLVVKRVAAVAGDPVPAELVAGWEAGAGSRGAGRSTVPPGRVVVLGDNRRVSFDSRHWGHLDQQLIQGVVLRALTTQQERR